MSKTALKIIAVAATVIAGIAISFSVVTENIRSLEKELNELLEKKHPTFKGWVRVDQLEAGSLKVRVSIYNPDCSVRVSEQFEHSRYLGWSAARSWLADTSIDMQRDAA